MHVKITVKRHKQTLGKQFIDIQCIAQSDSIGSDIDTNIFVIQKLPKNAIGQQTSRFSHIADPVDLQDYPPQQTQDSPYFRTNKIILRVRSQLQVARIISVMQQQLQSLRASLALSPITQQTFNLVL